MKPFRFAIRSLIAVPTIFLATAATAFAEGDATGAGSPLLGSIGVALLAILLGALCGRGIRSLAAKSLERQEKAAREAVKQNRAKKR